MILVVDSGSTKTDWFAIDPRGQVLFSTQTLGLNPQVLSSAILNERIINNYELYQQRDQVTHLYFYGAGCGVESPKKRIEKVFREIFTQAYLDIQEDTYAAAYATVTPEQKSIVCILGTGSNCSYFNGSSLEQRVTSLGYVLMDEASGNFYGKQLIRSYYFNSMPDYLRSEFEQSFDLDPDIIKENIYRKENPNTYLARFTRFLIEHKNEPVFQEIIHKGLDRFIQHQILQFDDAQQIPIHFVGSIAFFLKDEVEQALKRENLSLGNVVKRPIDGLVSYHKGLLDQSVL